MPNETYLEHIWVNIPTRTVKILDSEGYDEVINWKFDAEGSEGFAETLASFAAAVPSEIITYLS